MSNNLIQLAEKELFKDCDFCKQSKKGVYLVCVKTQYKDFKLGKEKIVYIGSSVNIKKRLSRSSHPYMLLYQKLEQHLVYTRSYLTENHIEVEKLLIKKYKPILNKTYNGKGITIF